METAASGNMTIPPSLSTWKKVLSLCLGAAACSGAAGCSAEAGDSWACKVRTQGRNPSKTARTAARRTTAADLELAIDIFIVWFGFWCFKKVLPSGLFFLFFGWLSRLGLRF